VIDAVMLFSILMDGYFLCPLASLGRAIINQSRLDFNQDSKESKEKRNDELATFF
jgi:hypothetical protein